MNAKTKHRRHRLDSFFSAERIAVIGASERGMYPAGILRSLLDNGYDGEIYPINPRREQVFGLDCYPDVTRTPLTPDLAIIIVPREAVIGALEQCIRVGVPAALVISAGFAEADERGKQLQVEMAELGRTSALTVLGPNCAGFADLSKGLIATRLPAPPVHGPVSFVSQSGALMMALHGVFADRGIGINRLISLGNQVDINLAEVLAYLAEDEGTEVISAFIESVQDGAEFTRALYKALINGKPVVLVKSGRTMSGQQAAATHTAALAGSDRVFDAVCRQFGAIRVFDIDELANIVKLLVAFRERISDRGRVAIVSQSGGMGSLTADLVELAGLTAPPLSESLAKRLHALPHIDEYSTLGNPTDVRGLSVIGESTAQTLEPFLLDTDTDIVLLLLAKSAIREQDSATAAAIVDAAQQSNKPLCVVWVGRRIEDADTQHPLATEIFREAGIPIFTQPSDCVDALASIVNYHRFRATSLKGMDAPVATDMKDIRTNDHILLPFSTTLALLEKYDVPLAEASMVHSADEAATAARQLGYPVALKAIVTDITHKTDEGLVHLGLASEESVHEKSTIMLETLASQNLEGLLVQRLLQGGVEVILGIIHDPQFGPLLGFGPGGILVELLDDMKLVIPPVTSTQALALIRQSQVWPLLAGFRGASAADVTALVNLIVKLSHVAVEQTGILHSLDLNPVIIMPEGQGAWVVDQRATTYRL